ncbi:MULTISPECIES: hypothetical protein [unclassified Pseudoxanthomonas]|uniref:hypothetical protein n=1 Tax=unclassified Pseudoxanthomonas TaxID=2645906 RepID=UPI0030771D29
MKNKITNSVYERLKRLDDAEPVDAESLQRWYEEAQELVALLRNDPFVCDQVPIRVWQFLSDADIRMKDKEYAALQRRIIKVFIGGLEEGIFLSGKQIDERIDAGSDTDTG